MKTWNLIGVSCLFLLGLSAVALADGEGIVAEKIYDRERGELSVGAEAPTPEMMVNAIRSATPTTLYAMLEYGERVECYECIPWIEKRLLDSSDAQVREISAWWLRKRQFGYGRVAVKMREVVRDDSDPVRRARAAEALGEFLDVRGLAVLSEAAMEDDSAEVRGAAVRALGRLNVEAATPILAAAFEDRSVSVRRAALDQVLRVNFFSDAEALLGRLGDDDAQVRLRAAQIAGEYDIAEAVVPLVGLLRSDGEASVRQAAAWALGRIGGSDAKAALREAGDSEDAKHVKDAIAVALRMR